MSKSLTVILALAAGLAGGMLNRYIAPSAAHAQTPQPPSTAEIRAQSFVLVDSADQTIGTFTSEPPLNKRSLTLPDRIVLRDQSGREIWSAGGTGIHPASER